MKNLASPDLAASNQAGAPRALLASPRHTLHFMAVCLVLTVVSAINGMHNSTADSPATPKQLNLFYAFVIGMEWMWVRFVYKGMREYQRSIVEFFGRHRLTLKEFGKDIVYATLAFGVDYFCNAGLVGLLQHGAQPANPVLPALPVGLLAVTLWVCLSLSAGVCEEIVFRGYLQRQLTVITGRVGIAILAQAILFGIGHGYEGIVSVLSIVLNGLVLGALAAWRGNIRAGILMHVAWDVLAGFGIVS
ncbi:CPBP family intramembrane glutamic endopeptidase [Paraburkholderia sp. BCC1876]|uniref:CPBP family intramembrane glutamic endopeptidase n=1 Tax=Paraburkholderia sp. BCC1876 TaxID=2676303 RepID=UPI001590840A|nr:CPBP family intramembrane glutamic endopeptidase [Paraburkholderia sp. BCC1876]